MTTHEFDSLNDMVDRAFDKAHLPKSEPAPEPTPVAPPKQEPKPERTPSPKRGAGRYDDQLGEVEFYHAVLVASGLERRV